jgi:NAD(P)H-flavin reductase
MILPRPISVNGYRDGVLTLAVAVKGEGTKRLCASQCGCALSVTGPLGKGFNIASGVRRALAVGGGIGIAPLLYAVRENPRIEWTACLGYRSGEHAYQLDEWKNLSHLFVSTDDGSLGKHGLVTEPLQAVLETEQPDLMICCGPVPMMRAVADTTREPKIKTVVSLNSVMVDGTGMCGGCRVAVGGKSQFACVDGPEFDAHEVDFTVLSQRNAMYREYEKQALDHFKEHQEEEVERVRKECRLREAEAAMQDAGEHVAYA